MAFRIAEIAYELGEESLSVNELFPGSEALVEKTGIGTVWKSHRTALQLASVACDKLYARVGQEKRTSIDCLILVSQSPTFYLPSQACLLQEMIKLPKSVLAFDVAQGCSGFVQALSIAVGLLPRFENILIVTTDTYREKLDQSDRATSALFSDAAAAILVTRNHPTHELIYERHFTDGSGGNALEQKCSPSVNRLSMNGREVVLFTRRDVVPQIRSSLEELEKLDQNLDIAFLHQASNLVLGPIVHLLTEQGVSVPSNIKKVGNTVSSSIPILMESSLGEISEKSFMLSGFGVGLSSSTLIAKAIN